MPKNPKLVVDAFIPDPLKLGTIPLNPMTMATVLILDKIKCPLMDAKNKGKKHVPLTNDDLARLAFVMASPTREQFALLQQGQAAFDLAAFEFSARIRIEDLAILGKRIAEFFASAMRTAGQIQEPSDAQKKTGAGRPDTATAPTHGARSGATSATPIADSAGA